MNCQECLPIFDEYLEKELDKDTALQIELHLSDCAQCLNYYYALKMELEIYVRHLSDVEATPALWNGIRTGIEEYDLQVSVRPRVLHNWFINRFGIRLITPASLAVALFLLMTAGLIASLIRYRYSEKIYPSSNITQNIENSLIPTSPQPASVIQENVLLEAGKINNEGHKQAIKIVAADINIRGKRKEIQNSARRLPSPDNFTHPSATVIRQLTTDEVAKRAEQEYIRAIDKLTHDMKYPQKQLLLEKASPLAQSLATIDRTIDATRRAVRAQPGDPAAIQYMTTAYSKKVEFLRTIAGY